MKHFKIYLIAALFIILFSRFGLAAEIDRVDNFNGVKWGVSVKDIKGMQPVSIMGEDISYARPNDSSNIQGIELDSFAGISILYGAYYNQMYQGALMYLGEKSFDRLKRKFINDYGMWSDYNMERDRGILRLFWYGEKVELMLLYNIKHQKGYIMYTYKPIRDIIQ